MGNLNFFSKLLATWPSKDDNLPNLAPLILKETKQQMDNHLFLEQKSQCSTEIEKFKSTQQYKRYLMLKDNNIRNDEYQDTFEQLNKLRSKENNLEYLECTMDYYREMQDFFDFYRLKVITQGSIRKYTELDVSESYYYELYRLPETKTFAEYGFWNSNTRANTNTPVDKSTIVLCTMNDFVGVIPDKNLEEIDGFPLKNKSWGYDLLQKGKVLTPAVNVRVKNKPQQQPKVIDPVILYPLSCFSHDSPIGKIQNNHGRLEGYVMVTAWGEEAELPEFMNAHRN